MGLIFFRARAVGIESALCCVRGVRFVVMCGDDKRFLLGDDSSEYTIIIILQGILVVALNLCFQISQPELARGRMGAPVVFSLSLSFVVGMVLNNNGVTPG